MSKESKCLKTKDTGCQWIREFGNWNFRESDIAIIKSESIRTWEGIKEIEN